MARESPAFAHTRWLLDRKQYTLVVPLNMTSILESQSSLSWHSSNESWIALSRPLCSVLSQVSASAALAVPFCGAASFELARRGYRPPPVIFGRKPELFN